MYRTLTQVATSDTTIVFERDFQASPTRVFTAMTRPDLVRKWMFSPPGWTWSECSMDVRTGGTYRWAWKNGDGNMAMVLSGIHTLVQPPNRVLFTQFMEMLAVGPCQEGTALPPPWNFTVMLELIPVGDACTMTMTLTFDGKAGRDMAQQSGMELGMEAGYRNLDALLATNQIL